MKIDALKKVCVAGAGQMGRQIALTIALHGYDVYLTDSVPAALAQTDTWSRDYLDGRVSKGKMTSEQADAARARFHLVPTLQQAAAGSQIVIEAILEDREIKRSFYFELGGIVGEDTILASNSSYMVSSLFQDCVKTPSRLANMHFFNPALVLKLVEVVKGEHTAPDTVELMVEFAKKIGKTPIRVNREIDGFVVNRVLRAIRDEAYFLVEEGVCTPEDLDIGVELGLNHPMGPFRLLDLTGIDLNYMSMEQRWKDTGIKPHGYDIAKQMYESHLWGRKTGKGFYTYGET